MTRAKYQTKNVRNVHPFIKGAVVSAAREADTTISDVVGGVLASKFRLAYVPTGRGFVVGSGNGDQLLVRLPESMHKAIWQTARDLGVTESAAVQLILAEYFDIQGYLPATWRGGSDDA